MVHVRMHMCVWVCGGVCVRERDRKRETEGEIFHISNISTEPNIIYPRVRNRANVTYD